MSDQRAPVGDVVLLAALIVAVAGLWAIATTPLDADWSTLPLSNFYLPFVQSAVRYLAAGAVPNRNLRPGQVLEANTTYHYVITAKGPDGSFWRFGGRFSMGGRDVRVVWEKIKIINDSDDVGCGEVDLWFWANYGQSGGKYLGIGRFNNDTARDDRRGCFRHLVAFSQRGGRRRQHRYVRFKIRREGKTSLRERKRWRYRGVQRSS